jgi:hypothetical protein
MGQTSFVLVAGRGRLMAWQDHHEQTKREGSITF